MTTLEHLAAHAKTSTEAEARARVTWERLQELAGESLAARKAVYASMPQTGYVNVSADLDRLTLIDKFHCAEDVYQAALRKYQEQQS